MAAPLLVRKRKLNHGLYVPDVSRRVKLKTSGPRTGVAVTPVATDEAEDSFPTDRITSDPTYFDDYVPQNVLPPTPIESLASSPPLRPLEEKIDYAVEEIALSGALGSSSTSSTAKDLWNEAETALQENESRSSLENEEDKPLSFDSSIRVQVSERRNSCQQDPSNNSATIGPCLESDDQLSRSLMQEVDYEAIPCNSPIQIDRTHPSTKPAHLCAGGMQQDSKINNNRLRTSLTKHDSHEGQSDKHAEVIQSQHSQRTSTASPSRLSVDQDPINEAFVVDHAEPTKSVLAGRPQRKSVKEPTKSGHKQQSRSRRTGLDFEVVQAGETSGLAYKVKHYTESGTRIGDEWQGTSRQSFFRSSVTRQARVKYAVGDVVKVSFPQGQGGRAAIVEIRGTEEHFIVLQWLYSRTDAARCGARVPSLECWPKGLCMLSDHFQIVSMENVDERSGQMFVDGSYWHVGSKSVRSDTEVEDKLKTQLQ